MIVLSVFNMVYLVEFAYQQIPKATKFFKAYVLKRKLSGEPEAEGNEIKNSKVK